MRRKALVRVILGGGGLCAVAVLWFVLQTFPLGGSGRGAVVDVKFGDSLSQIATKLHDAGVLASPLAFQIDLALFGDVQVQSGYYDIPQGASFATIRRILGGGPNVAAIGVTPGLTLWEIENQLAQAKGPAFATTFTNLAQQAASVSPYHPNGSLEGLIGPGIYVLTPNETPAALLAAMQASFNALAAQVGLTPQTTVEGLNAYQLIIAASIDEKEGYYPSNMPKVARVIFNRLATHDSLQMDSTVLYALHQDGGKVTPLMLQNPSPYNSYRHAGLTPTPICTVSTFSLNAVLHAPAGKWRYFVLINRDGTMAFSDTYAEQLANERLAASRGI